MIWLMVAFAVVVVLVRRRHRRRSTLAGLNVERPTYQLAPPRRWSTSLKDHTL